MGSHPEGTEHRCRHPSLSHHAADAHEDLHERLRDAHRHRAGDRAVPDSIADKEFLNYPSLGRYNPNGEWGFQAILYLVFSVGGFYGVSFLCWAVVFAIFLLLHRGAVLRGAHPLLAVLAIFAFSGFLRIRIQPRPELFTYFFVALTIFLFSEYFFGTRKTLIYLFPPAVLVWANSHPTYLMAFLLCGAFVADRLARAIWRKEFRWDTLKTWIFPPVLVGVAGLILCGLNPNGYNAILTPLHLLARGTEAGGGSSILMSISELTPVKGTGFFMYYKAAAVFAASPCSSAWPDAECICWISSCSPSPSRGLGIPRAPYR